jgi:hypothetical protein
VSFFQIEHQGINPDHERIVDGPACRRDAGYRHQQFLHLGIACCDDRDDCCSGRCHDGQGFAARVGVFMNVENLHQVAGKLGLGRGQRLLRGMAVLEVDFFLLHVNGNATLVCPARKLAGETVWKLITHGLPGQIYGLILMKEAKNRR